MQQGVAMEPNPQPKTAQQLNSLQELGESAVILPDGSIANILGPSTEEIASAYGSTRLFSLGGDRRLRIEFVGSDEDRLWLDSTRLALFELRWDGPFPEAKPGSWIEPILKKGRASPSDSSAENSPPAALPQGDSSEIAGSDLLAVTTPAIVEFRRKNTDCKATLFPKAIAIVLKGFQRRWITIRNWEVVEMTGPGSPKSTPAGEPPESATRRWELVKDPRGNNFVRTWDADEKESNIKLGKVLFDILTVLAASQGNQATWFELQRREILRSSHGENRNRLRRGQLLKQEPFIQLKTLGIIASDEERIRLATAPLDRTR